jgi:Cys-tRNA(Pro)/Cys-tRNA(Cys) deacylase
VPINTPATRALDELSIPYSVYEHTHLPGSLEETARERGQLPQQIIRSILFRYQKDGFFLTLAAGPGQISWRRLRTHMGVSRISMATRDEVLAITGYDVGTVSPFGVRSSIRLLSDAGVFTQDEISLGSGLRGVAIIMKSADLRRALGQIEVGQFC